MDKKTISNDPVLLAQVVKVPLKDIHLNVNLGRDATIGDHGHDDGSIDRLAYAISLEGGLIHPVILAPKGYTDDRVVNTPSDKHPIKAGFGRFLAYRKLNRDNPTDERWFTIPALIAASGGNSFRSTSLLENLVRKDLGTVEKANAIAAFKVDNGLNDVQIARLYGLNKTTVAQLEKIRRLPNSFKDLLNDSEMERGIFTEPGKSNVREGVILKKLTFAFSQQLVTRIETLLAGLGVNAPMPDDIGKYANMVYQNWEKTGEWTIAPLEKVAADAKVDLVKKRKEATPAEPPKSAEGESQVRPETPSTQSESVTPGNGADKGMGRADQSGNPKPTTPSANEGKSVRDMLGKPKNENNGPWDVIAGAQDIGEILASYPAEAAQALGNIILAATYYMIESRIRMGASDREKFLQALAIAFPKAESAGN